MRRGTGAKQSPTTKENG